MKKKPFRYFHKPGPSHLEPGLCPGGVVIHVYSVPTNKNVKPGTARDELLLARNWDPYTSMGMLTQDAEFVATMSKEVCLVGYDGDTGERMDLQNILGKDRM